MLPSVRIIFGAAVRPDGSPSGVLRRRVEAALASARDDLDGLFLVTGAVGRFGPSEAVVMATLLEEAGVSPERILLEEAGTDTLSSALRCCEILEARRNGVGRILVCTSAFHAPRCRRLLRLLGVRASVATASRDRRGSRPLRHLYFVLREAPASVWDVTLVLLGRWIGRLRALDPPLGDV